MMDSETTSNTAVSPSPSSPAFLGTRTTATPVGPSSSPKSPRRDDEFYCQDIVLLVSKPSLTSMQSCQRPPQVEDVLFKVPRRPFESESEVFSAMFELPPINGAYCVEGSSDDNPIRLDGVKEDEFRPLMWVMFRK